MVEVLFCIIFSKIQKTIDIYAKAHVMTARNDLAKIISYFYQQLGEGNDLKLDVL